MAVSIELDEAGKNIVIHAEFRYKELCKSLPGATWKGKENAWNMPVSWSGCLALRSTFRDDLVIGDRLSEWAVHERVSRIDPATFLREQLDFEGANEDLYGHQRAGVEFLATARQALLADEPGLGKTAQAIRALKRLHDKGEPVFPAMIVCPNTLKKNWAIEFEKWWPGVNVQVITGTAIQRRKQFQPFLEPSDDEPQPDVIVMNWESLRSHSRLAPYGSTALKKCQEHGGLDSDVKASQCEVHTRELNMIDFKAVIADEIHRSKDPKSKQTRALWAATGNAEFRFALTGTPISADVVDLWAILHWLQPDEWPSKTKWIDRMVDVMLNAFGGMMVQGIKPEMQDEFYKALYPRMRRMLKKVVLPWLPEVVIERRDVEMSPKQKKAYKQMQDNMIAELEGGEILTAPSILSQMGRLTQFALSNATMSTDPDTGEVEVTLVEPSSKVDALVSDIKSGDFGEDSVAVTAVSRQLIDMLSARLTKEKIDHGLIVGGMDPDARQKAIEDFQSGKTKWILFTAQAGGVGVTLTTARQLVRLQRPWSLVDDKQVMDRVHRIGSEIHDSILIKDYFTENTVEERVLEVLHKKGGNFEEIVRDQEQILNMLKDTKEGH